MRRVLVAMGVLCLVSGCGAAAGGKGPVAGGSAKANSGKGPEKTVAKSADADTSRTWVGELSSYLDRVEIAYD